MAHWLCCIFCRVAGSSASCSTISIKLRADRVPFTIVCSGEIVALYLPGLSLMRAGQRVSVCACEVVSLECAELCPSIVPIAVLALLVLVHRQPTVIQVHIEDTLVVRHRLSLSIAYSL
jgi:hypothetical protein